MLRAVSPYFVESDPSVTKSNKDFAVPGQRDGIRVLKPARRSTYPFPLYGSRGGLWAGSPVTGRQVRCDGGRQEQRS